MSIITSTQSKHFKFAKKLYTHPLISHEYFVIEGPNLIRAAQAHNLIVDKLDFSEALLNKISKSHQGQMAVVKKPVYDLSVFSKMNKILLLDAVQDPGNVGTIIRTAAGLGIDGILLTNKSANVWSPKVVRSTAGAIFNIPIIQSVEFSDLEQLKSDFRFYATTLASDSIALKEVEFAKKSLIIFGNEANGISDSLIKIADVKVKIPIASDKIESLNVAVSSGIVLYELHQQI